MANPTDKSPLSSKKFIALLVSEARTVGTITLLAIHGNSMSSGSMALIMTVSIIAGFIEVGYLGGQTWLDRYIKLPAIGGDKDGGP